MTKQTKIIYWLGLGGILTSILMMSIVLYWVIYPYPTTDIIEPIEILNENNEIAVGEKIILSFQIDKPNDDRPDTEAVITCDDGNLVTLANIPIAFPEGQYNLIIDNYLLPPKVLEGSTCRFEYTKSYYPNPFRDIVQTAVSEDFLVVERES